MQRNRPTQATAAAARPRPRRAAGWSLTVVLTLIAGCSGTDSNSSSRPGARSGSGEHDEPKKANTEIRTAGTVELATDMQVVLQLKIEALSAASAPQELTGYGRVLDPTPLAAAVSEWAVARASAVASEQELDRTKLLQKQNTASVRALQAAESAAARDRLAVESIRDRISLSWGRAVARRSDLNGLLRELTAQDRVIVRVEVPVGEAPSSRPLRARLASLSDPQRTIEAEFVGPAPVTDPQLQGQGFLFLTQRNALDLTPGAAVTAYLELGGEAQSGVFVPASALVQHDSRLWVYAQKSETSFARIPVSLGPPMREGWLIARGVRAGDRVVTQGAQMLLSEDLKPQISLPD
ncbi:MAG: uncharacterized protein JWN43_3657 [Gammaproteobacteria bacterium]|nr:uncharacterized protein [Gammaproteobacteria bacterium]